MKTLIVLHHVVRQALVELTRFCGHPSVCIRGVHHVEIGTTLPT
jgi:hypothetical protein